MSRLTILSVAVITLLFSCGGQSRTIPKKEIHNKDFNWTITIPENFENVHPKEWERLRNKGIDAIEDTYEDEVIDQVHTIFVFKSDDFNYFESNYQPFDPDVDGDYLESCKNVNEMLYGTFMAQMPNARIDTTSSIEKIDGLEFQTFKVKVEYPNKMILNAFMYSRLFDKKEFTVNIMYVDEKKGELVLDSWLNSTFTK